MEKGGASPTRWADTIPQGRGGPAAKNKNKIKIIKRLMGPRDTTQDSSIKAAKAMPACGILIAAALRSEARLPQAPPPPYRLSCRPPGHPGCGIYSPVSQPSAFSYQLAPPTSERRED